MSNGGLPAYAIVLAIILPLAIGAIIGALFGLILRFKMNRGVTLLTTAVGIVATVAVGYMLNVYVMPAPILNFMMMGMAFFAAIANLVSKERLEEIITVFQPILNLAIVVVIFNLGAGLDWHAIAGAGLYTLVYILVRAVGKYGGASLGATITKAPKTVKKYLGFTLLTHSGVSLVFTGIAVSVLMPADPDSAKIIQGTIAAAAVINELIAVFVAKKGFEWAGEIGGDSNDVNFGRLIYKTKLSK